MIRDCFFTSGPGAKVGRKQEGAVVALLNTWTVEEAARVAGVGYKTLLRWINKDQNFKAVLRAADDAEYTRSTARFRQRAPGAATSLLQVTVEHRAGPATQLRAAVSLLGHVQDANEIDKIRVEVEGVERGRKASLAQSGKSRLAGHGAKFPRRMQKAIGALLTEPSVAQAARVAGIGYQTLLRWMAQTEFLAAFAAAASAAFAPAVRILRRGMDTAVSVVIGLSKSAIPAATRANADDYILNEAKASEVKDLKARVAAAEPVPAGATDSEPERTSKMIGKDLYQSVRRLKDLWSPPRGPRMRIELVDAHDGRPAGPTSTIEADGRRLWSKPPDGCRKGEPVEAHRGTNQDPAERLPVAA